MSDRLLDIEISGAKSLHQYDELARIFLQPSEYVIHGPGETVSHEKKYGGISDPVAFTDIYHLRYDVSEDESQGRGGDRYVQARRMYEDLAAYTGKRPKWGVLTGIRPVKLAGELHGGRWAEIFRHNYLVHPEKIDLVGEILDYQRDMIGDPAENGFSMYIGIPFCPTRCMYCSFTSNKADVSEMKRYTKALEREIEACAKATRELGMRPESIYMGGGTPTALTEDMLDELLGLVRKSFDMSGLKEFTVEAGRPDTVTDEKLHVLKEHDIDKISINPQSMKQETLDIIGRKHSVEDVVVAFEKARKHGIRSINMDMIAGLPEESASDFTRTLDEIIGMGPDRITVHTLAVKRASKLKEKDENFSYRDEELREEMLSYAGQRLRRAEYRPYYLYRQKYTSGNTENIGWCRNDDVGVYNIRIMDEHQPILAMGAGGISKAYFPDENRLERIPNVSNYQIYIDKIDEMIERKLKHFFTEKGDKSC